MREDPYPARYYARLADEPIVTAADLPLSPLQLRPQTKRLLLILLTLYLLAAIFLMSTAVSYAAPSTAATPVKAQGADCSYGAYADYD